jgi:hypothetical protein
MQNDAFSNANMTAAINIIPYVPGRISRLNIFVEKPVTDKIIAIERRKGTLSLLPTVQRGGVATQNAHQKRDLRWVEVPHIPLTDTIKASELRDVRSFGSAAIQKIQEVRDQRFQEMTWKFDVTVEWQMAGALKGQILDADGETVLLDLNAFLGTTPLQLDFLLATYSSDSPTTNSPKLNIAKALRQIENTLGEMSWPEGQAYALVGNAFWDALVTHPEVTFAYQRWVDNGNKNGGEGGFLRSDQRYRGFEYGGVFWENYRGTVGGQKFIADDAGILFPLGVPQMYEIAYAPADFLDTINEPGLPRYARQEVAKFGRGIELWMESNPLAYCSRPDAVVQLTSSDLGDLT